MTARAPAGSQAVDRGRHDAVRSSAPLRASVTRTFRGLAPGQALRAPPAPLVLTPALSVRVSDPFAPRSESPPIGPRHAGRRTLAAAPARASGECRDGHGNRARRPSALRDGRAPEDHPRRQHEPAASDGAGGGNRTHTLLAEPRILSPVRLPVSPPRRESTIPEGVRAGQTDTAIGAAAGGPAQVTLVAGPFGADRACVRRHTPRRRRSPRGVFRHSGDAPETRRAAPPGAPRFRPTLAPAGV